MIDKFFFVLYNAYYRDGQYGKSESPKLTVCGLLGLVLFSWFLFLLIFSPFILMIVAQRIDHGEWPKFR